MYITRMFPIKTYDSRNIYLYITHIYKEIWVKL